MAASKEGSVTGSEFTPIVSILSDESLLLRKHLTGVLSLSSSSLRASTDGRKVLREAQKYAEWVWSANNGKLPQRDDTASLRCSLYLKVLLAALLRSLYEIDNNQFWVGLQSLAWTLPPFGSWSTSTPASEDHWLDPADEVVDPESTLPWDVQVD